MTGNIGFMQSMLGPSMLIVRCTTSTRPLAHFVADNRIISFNQQRNQKKISPALANEFGRSLRSISNVAPIFSIIFWLFIIAEMKFKRVKPNSFSWFRSLMSLQCHWLLEMFLFSSCCQITRTEMVYFGTEPQCIYHSRMNENGRMRTRTTDK